jgi:hypothetical protein
MSQPSDTFDSYDSIGTREDLSDVIYNISPTDTPFLSACAKEKATNTYHEWQLDTLASVGDNKVIEGDDATTDAITATVRRGNYTQISDKVPLITGTQEVTNKAGRKSEMAYQIAKMGKEIKRDMENALVGLNNARVGGNASTARELASVQSWIATNVDKDAGGTNPTGDGTDARADSVTQRAFTETMLKNVLQLCWTEGGNPETIMVGAFNKRVASGFTGGATRLDKSEDKKLYATVDVYVSDFGEHKIVANRFSRTRDCLVLDMEYWKIAYLRPFKTEDLAKTGDTMRKQMIVEYTLQSCNQKASGIVADLTTS